MNARKIGGDAIVRTILRVSLVILCLFLIGSFLGTVDSQARMTTMVAGGGVAAAGGGASFEIEALDDGIGSGSAAATVSATAGALLVATVANETQASASDVITIASNPTLTWVRAIRDGGAGGSNGGCASIYYARFSAGGSITVTASGTGRTSIELYSVTGDETTPSGATATNTGAPQTAPSVAITTTNADSLLFVVTSDFNAVSGASRAYRTGVTHTERLYDYQNGAYTGYHYTSVASTATSYTMGLTAPNTQAANTLILEVRKP